MARQLREPIQKLQFARPIAPVDDSDDLRAEVRRLRMTCDTLIATLDELVGAVADAPADSLNSDLQRAARRARQMLVGIRAGAPLR